MINLAGCELCSCNHKIRWHFCFLVERKHYICASHNFITAAFGKKELCQSEDAVEKMWGGACTHACAHSQYKCLRDSHNVRLRLGKCCLAGFASSLFPFVYINFEARKLGNLEPLWSPPGTTQLCCHTCATLRVVGNQLDIHQQLHITPRSSSLIVRWGHEQQLRLFQLEILAEILAQPPRPGSRDYRDTALKCPLNLTGLGILKGALTSEAINVSSVWGPNFRGTEL